MVLIEVQKKSPSNKLHVMAFEWLSKEQAATIKIIPGMREIIEDVQVPEGFYDDPYNWYLEGGQLRSI